MLPAAHSRAHSVIYRRTSTNDAPTTWSIIACYIYIYQPCPCRTCTSPYVNYLRAHLVIYHLLNWIQSNNTWLPDIIYIWISQRAPQGKFSSVLASIWSFASRLFKYREEFRDECNLTCFNAQLRLAQKFILVYICFDQFARRPGRWSECSGE